MSSAVCHIVTIEGIGNATGQVRYCYPVVPDYGTAAYVAGLAERPSVTTGEWRITDNQISIGRFTLAFAEGVGPIRWMQTRPPERNATSGAHNASVTDILVMRKPGDLGWGDQTVLYTERETVKISSGTAASPPRIGVTRGYAGSTADAHPDLSVIWERPPVLVGRQVTVYETPRTGGDAGDEIVVLRGFISSEPAMRGFMPSISVSSTWTSPKFGVSDPGSIIYCSGRAVIPDDVAPSPGVSGGSYWILQDGSVWANSGNSQLVHISGESERNFADFDVVTGGLQVLYSDLAAPYPPFGRDPTPATPAPEVSDNPFVIVLNFLLTSATGDNYVAGDDYSYDLGDYDMWPAYGLGIPRAQVDVPGFETAIARHGPIHCDRLWVGGRTPEPAWACIRRILTPIGYACGATRNGTIRLLKLEDVYPGDTTVAITRSHVMSGSASHQTMSRAVDTIILKVEPDALGETHSLVRITETGEQSLYPSQIGETLTIAKAPYSAVQFEGDENVMMVQLANVFRRVARSVPLVSVSLIASQFESHDIGDKVTLYDRSVVDPKTGITMTDTTAALKGQVTSIKADYGSRTLEVQIAVSDTGNVCLISPSAAVEAYDAGDKFFTITDSVYGGSPSDGETFAAGDKIVLLNSHLDPVSGDVMTVISADETEIWVDANDDGYVIGSVLVYALWDASSATQRASGYGYDADGGAETTDYPTLGSGGDSPFVYGD